MQVFSRHCAAPKRSYNGFECRRAGIVGTGALPRDLRGGAYGATSNGVIGRPSNALRCVSRPKASLAAAPHAQVLTQLDAVDAAPATGAVLKVSSTLSWRDAAPLFNALAASTPPPLQVDMSQTQLRDAEVFKTVVSFARSFKLLAHLQLAGCGLTDSHLATLVEALHHGGSTVETLDIGSNGGGAATTAALAAFLVHPACQVTRLALDNNRIGDTNGVLLATEGISSCKSLRTLCLRRCGLGQRAGHALVRALDRNAALLHLHLDYNLLQSALITAIDGRLAANRKVRAANGAATQCPDATALRCAACPSRRAISTRCIVWRQPAL